MNMNEYLILISLHPDKYCLEQKGIPIVPAYSKHGMHYTAILILLVALLNLEI